MRRCLESNMSKSHLKMFVTLRDIARHARRLTEPDYPISKTPYCNVGKCKAVLAYVSLRVCSRQDPQVSGCIIPPHANESKHCNRNRTDQTYRFRCSNLLNNRPHVGIGQECDFCGYGPNSIIVALLALLTGPAWLLGLVSNA